MDRRSVPQRAVGPGSSNSLVSMNSLSVVGVRASSDGPNVKSVTMLRCVSGKSLSTHSHPALARHGASFVTTHSLAGPRFTIRKFSGPSLGQGLRPGNDFESILFGQALDRVHQLRSSVSRLRNAGVSGTSELREPLRRSVLAKRPGFECNQPTFFAVLAWVCAFGHDVAPPRRRLGFCTATG